MPTRGRRAASILALMAIVLGCMPRLAVGQAHFGPGVASIRDYAVPEPGLYVALYDYWYKTSKLADDNGEPVSTLVIGRPTKPTRTVGLDIDVSVHALAPVFLWSSSWKVFGATYGAYVAPALSNSSIAASLSTVNGRGINPSTGQF